MTRFFFPFLLLSGLCFSQNNRVEAIIFGAHTGLSGLWVNTEFRLFKSLALKGEIGIENDFSVGSHYDGAGFILQPVITVEPKIYYNLKKRNDNGKSTKKNGANFVSLKTSFHPDWFVINLDPSYKRIADLAIVPTWGIRRLIGEHFTYEIAGGLGYRIVYLKDVDPFYYEGGNPRQYVPYLSLRIGYTL